MNTELDKARKQLVLAAHHFWEVAQDGDDLHWLFTALANNDEGSMEDLMEKHGLDYSSFADDSDEGWAKVEALYK